MPRTEPTIHTIGDDESVRRALQRLIRSVGFNVVAFASAEEFLLAPGPAPGCIVLDIHLPGLNGLELLLQFNAEGREIPVVFISAYVDDPTRRLAMQAGGIAFLQKTLRQGALLCQ